MVSADALVSGYFKDSTAGFDICTLCDSNCKTCLTSRTTCVSCSVGKYLDSPTCRPCATYCSTCIDYTACTACTVGYYLYADSSCGSCTAGYYIEGVYCKACDSRCFTCSGPVASNCLSCTLPRRLSTSNSCVMPATSCLGSEFVNI